MAQAYENISQQGVLLGKMPGMKEWNRYSLKLTRTHLHILDELGRKNLRSLEMDSSDMTGEDTKNKKGFCFYLLRPGDGRYTFKCDSPQEQCLWITQLQRVIHGDDGTLSPSGRGSILDTPLPPVPSSPRSSIISNDSGIGVSAGGEVKRGGRGYRSAPVSGDGQFMRSMDSNSDGGRVPVKVVEEQQMSYDKCKWFWGTASRQEAERRLLSEGKMGNFVVRINANGHYVMTYWRKDGIHHHKILNHGTIFRFEKSAVEAEGESLVDLLDTYMKANSTKTKPMEPFGGALYEMYNYAWTPPAFNMSVLEERLKEQKKVREQAASKVSQRPQQYTPVDIGDSTSDSSSREDSGSGSSRTRHTPRLAAVEEPVTKTKPLPPVPPNKKQGAKKPPAPVTKPKPSKEHPVHEPPEYANCNFGPATTRAPPPTAPPPTSPPPEEDNVYMNIHPAPLPPSRKQRTPAVTESAPSEYQNIGAHIKRRVKK